MRLNIAIQVSRKIYVEGGMACSVEKGLSPVY